MSFFFLLIIFLLLLILSGQKMNNKVGGSRIVPIHNLTGFWKGQYLRTKITQCGANFTVNVFDIHTGDAGTVGGATQGNGQWKFLEIKGLFLTPNEIEIDQNSLTPTKGKISDNGKTILWNNGSQWVKEDSDQTKIEKRILNELYSMTKGANQNLEQCQENPQRLNDLADYARKIDVDLEKRTRKIREMISDFDKKVSNVTSTIDNENKINKNTLTNLKNQLSTNNLLKTSLANGHVQSTFLEGALETLKENNIKLRQELKKIRRKFGKRNSTVDKRIESLCSKSRALFCHKPTDLNMEDIYPSILDKLQELEYGLKILDQRCFKDKSNGITKRLCQRLLLLRRNCKIMRMKFTECRWKK